MNIQRLPVSIPAVPFYRKNAGKFFMPDYTRWVESDIWGGHTETAPLAPNVDMGLLGLTLTEKALANGTMEVTDSVNPEAVGIERLYFRVNGLLMIAELDWTKHRMTSAPNIGDRQLRFQGQVEFVSNDYFSGKATLAAALDTQTGKFRYDVLEVANLPDGAHLAGLDLHYELVNHNRRRLAEADAAA